MEFTGERYVPEVHGNIELEHIHRYLLACEIAGEIDILDIACGEGYGAAMLAGKAKRVIGIDISAESVDYARRRYPNRNLEFIEGSCLEIPIPSASVDLVVSFETIEHVDEHDQMMAELKRVLRPNGTLLISSPDKNNYSIEPNYSNPFHKKELYHHEFEQLVGKYFKQVIFYGQRVGLGSWISSGGTQNYPVNYFQENEVINSIPGIAKPVYWIAIASDLQPPELSTSFFEQPIEDSELVRSWKGILSEREQAILTLNNQREERERLLQGLAGQIAEKDQAILSFASLIVEKDQAIHSLVDQVAARDQSLQAFADQIGERNQSIQTLEVVIAERDQTIQGLKDQLRNREEEIAAYATSTSWRITRPLRKISQLLQKRNK